MDVGRQPGLTLFRWMLDVCDADGVNMGTKRMVLSLDKYMFKKQVRKKFTVCGCLQNMLTQTLALLLVLMFRHLP